MLNMYGTVYGAGVQTSTLYLRTNSNFAVYINGSHADGLLDSGGGINLLTANSTNLTYLTNSIWHTGNFSPDSYGTYARHSSLLSGGGVVTVTGNSVKWAQRFIVMGTGQNGGSASGYYDIAMPAANTVITGYMGATDVTVTSDGIPFGSWQTLYVILPPNGGNGSATFGIASYSAGPFQVPANWMPLIRVNSDGGNTFYLPNGVRLTTGESVDMNASYDNFRSPVNMANTLTVTGHMSTSSSVFVNGSSLYVQGNGNRHLWFRTLPGVNRGLLYHDHVNEMLALQLYNANGTFIRNATWNQAGEANWSGNYTVTGQLKGSTLLVTSNNGSGDNITIGDDARIGDVNVSNTVRLTGIADATQGYMQFGSGGARIGFDNANWIVSGGSNLIYQSSAITSETTSYPKVGTRWPGLAQFHWQIRENGRFYLEAYNANNVLSYPLSIGLDSSMTLNGALTANSIKSMGDMSAGRSSNTGYYFMGYNNTAFVGSDGANFVMNGPGTLYVNNTEVSRQNQYHSASGYGFSGRVTYLYNDTGLDNLIIRTGPSNAYKYSSFSENGSFTSAGSGRFNGDLTATARVIVGDGQTASWITMRDNDEGERYIHNNGGNIGFLTRSGTWSFQSNNDGNIWTPLIGYITDYVAGVANTYANSVGNTKVAINGVYNWSDRSSPLFTARSQGAGIASEVSNRGALMIESASSNTGHASFIAFHLPGRFATYFGLDTDQQLKIGGWSHGNNSYRIHSHNNCNPIIDIRLNYAGQMDGGWNVGAGNYAEPYAGAVLTTLNNISSGTNQPSVSSGGRWRYLQKQDSYGNWYTVGYV